MYDVLAVYHDELVVDDGRKESSFDVGMPAL
jgi:hypothetical protein